MDAYIITILDYCLNEVRVYHFNSTNKPEDPEAWIKEHDKNWSDDQCYWMGADNTKICYMDDYSGEYDREETL